MEVQEKHPGEQVKHLERCINDLISMTALPALWTGGAPSQIGRTLIDVLQRMLDLQLIYVQLKDPLGEVTLELARVAQTSVPATQPREVRAQLNRLLGDDPQKWPSRIQGRFGDRNLSIVPLRIGLHGEIGMLVAGAERSDFPGQIEELLLRVAANHALIALHEARLRTRQKQLADELDQRVAQRTSELAAANHKLQLQVGLLQAIPVAAWTIRPDGTPDFVNQKWLEYTGQSLDYVVSEPEAWLTAVHPDDRDIASTSFWEGIRAGKDFAMEARFRRAQDGAYRWHLNRAVALRDSEDKIIKFVGTSTDIEDLKQSQQELRKTDERTRLIIDTALDAVVTMDASGTITSWNKQAEIMFGWSSVEAIGQHMSELIIPQSHRMAHESGLRHFLATGEGRLLRRRIEVTSIRRGGLEFPVELEVMPLELGEEWVFTAFIRDITDSKQSQEALRNTQAELANMTRMMMMGQLTASIAHEVNQPLSGIITNASTCLRMLDADPPNIGGARETARRTIRDGNRASEVITRLRALFSKRRATTEPVNLNEATREVIALLLSKLQRDGVILRSELADDLPLIAGDRVQLQQVIMNLLQNAADAMIDVHDRSRQLLIQTQRDEADHVRLTVQDSGIGFDPQAAGRLFDAFYTTKHDGMGIGLAVSRSIIENHQGRIWAQPNDGRGATFSFSIPQSLGSATGGRLPSSPREPAANQPAEVARNL
jgi:PAS domain S-box-containing protein